MANTYWHVLNCLAVAKSSCVIVFPHRIIKIHLIAEETETVKIEIIKNNIIVQYIMAGDWLTLILVRIVTSAIRRVPTLSSIGTSKEPVCPRVELILKIIIILLIIFLGFIKSKPC